MALLQPDGKLVKSQLKKRVSRKGEVTLQTVATLQDVQGIVNEAIVRILREVDTHIGEAIYEERMYLLRKPKFRRHWWHLRKT